VSEHAIRALRGAKQMASSTGIAYIRHMAKLKERLSPEDVATARERRLEAMHLQVIEGNPLDAEDVAMFEMFEREGWDHERRRAYILAKFRAVVAVK
jgi:hypothetical protein